MSQRPGLSVCRGWLVEGDALNATTVGDLVAKLGGKPDRDEDGVATL
ncbi:hypothetical protein [Aeromonas enteropelogenes]